MYNYIPIADVQTKENYHLLLTYANGEKRQFDMSPYLDLGIFKELKDPEMFKCIMG